MEDGRAIPSTDSDGLLVERALGIERAKIDKLAGSEPWLRDDPTDALVGLTKTIGGSWLPSVLAASDEDLARARDEAREIYPLVRVEKLHPDGSPRAAWPGYRLPDVNGWARV